MSKTASIITRVEPNIKQQAENVLNQLGISMATAMEIYLRQIALQRKIPFEMKLPIIEKPISYASLSNEEFNSLMEKSAKSYADGKCTALEDFKDEVSKKLF